MPRRRRALLAVAVAIAYVATGIGTQPHAAALPTRPTVAVELLPAHILPAQGLPAQSEGNGLAESSTTTYRIDPDAGRVQVEVEVRLRNVTTDRREGDVIRRQYFSGYYAVLPAGAGDPHASQGGTVLDGRRVSEQPGAAFSYWEFDLARNLFAGQSTTVVVRYDLAGVAPRSDVPWRVNPAYISFLAYGFGDPGGVELRVVLPAGYAFDDFVDVSAFQPVTADGDGDGETVYAAAGLDEDFEALISISDDDRLDVRPVLVGDAAADADSDADVRVLSWPGDDEWRDFTIERVETGVPELALLIGRPWPVDGTLDIRQTVEPEFHGYAGWYDSFSSEIALGEDLDADTLYHELSHAWFDSRLFRRRWAIEGFAQVYAAEMVRRDGGEPAEPAAPPASARGRLPLHEFVAPDGSVVDDTAAAARETYGYDASHFVVDAIADEIGFDALRDVLTALGESRSIYPVDSVDTATVSVLPASDARLFDVLEVIGGSELVANLFVEWVGDNDFDDTLAERAAARTDYAELAERAAPWSVPTRVRIRMEQWDFERAQDVIGESNEVLDQRDQLVGVLDELGIAIRDDIGTEFAAERSSFAAITAALVASTDNATATLDTVAAVRTLGDRLGVDPPDLAALLAHGDTATSGTPTAAALGRSSAVATIAAADAVADDQLAAFETVAAAAAAADSGRSFTVRIGLIGADVDAHLDEARTALGAGDHRRARVAADAAVALVDDAGSIGLRRITYAASAVGTLFVLAALLIWRNRRRHARSRAPDTATRPVVQSGGPQLDGLQQTGFPAPLIADLQLLTPQRTGIEQFDVDVPSAGSGGLFAAVSEHLDEDALPRARFGGVDDRTDVPVGDDGETA